MIRLTGAQRHLQLGLGKTTAAAVFVPKDDHSSRDLQPVSGATAALEESIKEEMPENDDEDIFSDEDDVERAVKAMEVPFSADAHLSDLHAISAFREELRGVFVQCFQTVFRKVFGQLVGRIFGQIFGPDFWSGL